MSVSSRVRLSYFLLENSFIDTFTLLDFRFTNTFLLRETGNRPSPASGVLQYISDKTTVHELGTYDADEKLLWLVEKRHPTSRVQRFSGTLSHPSSHSDLVHLTIYAFAHFVFGHTNRQLVFADLQGEV